MKTNFLAAAAAFAGFLPTALFAQTAGQYTITGTLQHVQAEWVYLVHAGDGQRIVDSARVDKNAYHFTGTVSESQPAVLTAISPLTARPTPKEIAELYLTPGAFSIAHVDSFSNTSFTGSPENELYKKLQAGIKPFLATQVELVTRYRAAKAAQNDSAAKAIETQYDSVGALLNTNVYASFVREHTNSPVALYALTSYAAGRLDSPAVRTLFDGLSVPIRESKAGKEFLASLEIAGRTSVGKQAMDFTQNDTAGRPVKLSSFKGKYVLLDFWASWCVPCRKENPNVVKAFTRYHAKGFDVLGVSLDRPGDREKWLQAIDADHLAWTQVSDLGFWKNAVAVAYGINSIPQNFLLDPTGKIIARNIRGEELNKKLEELFKD